MNESKTTQLVVIGAGPGGYAAAFRAADLGIQVTLIDPELQPGGTCLYKGCIPSKTLLHAAKILSDAKEAKNFGIEFPDPKIDIDRLRSFKESVVTKLTSGLSQLCKQRKITYVQGQASFLDSSNLLIRKIDKVEEKLSFQKAIIATGSKSMGPSLFHVSSRHLWDSNDALELSEVPKSLLIVGGGYIGLEVTTIYSALGSEITVVEMTDDLLPNQDRDIVSILKRNLTKNLKAVYLNSSVSKIEETKNGLRVTWVNTKNETTTEEFDKVLLAVGRKPHTENLKLEKTKVQLDEKGFVKTDERGQTRDSSIFAVGDVAGEPMLAHKASFQGRMVAEVIAGKNSSFGNKVIPAVIFTNPEIAVCGLSETQAAKKNRSFKVAEFPWTASGRAMTLNRTDGLTKLIFDPATKRILGASIIGVDAGDLISEAVVAIEKNLSIDDIKTCIHPHPTLSETLLEASEAALDKSIHIYHPPKK